MPATLQVPANQNIHDTLNHSNPTGLQDFKRDDPNSAAFILNKLKREKKYSQSFVPCVIGKAKRKPFKEVIDRTDEALDAVSTDTTGPITPVDHEGNAYLQLLVDAGAGHTKGFPMKKKSEAATAILKGIRRLELAIGKTVKRYHSDNAKEQRTKALLKELESKDTKISSTAPHSSQKNSIVEQRFQTIFAAERTALAESGLSRKYWSVACLDAIDKIGRAHV